jgi:peptide/nickel transport system permease protein
VVSSLALVLTVATVAVGGLPFALVLVVAALLVLASLPSSPRRYLLKRIGRVLASIMLSMALVWLLVHNYRDDSRLDDTGLFPAMVRYVEWISGLVSGEMGSSQYSESVGEGISRSLPISLQLVAYSQILALAISIPGALIGAQLRGRAGDVAARALSLLGLSLPVFITGPLLVQLLGLGELNLFGHQVGWKLLPVVRYVPVGDGLIDHLRSMAMPSLTLALSTAAIYLVLLRSELIQQLQSQHALLARSKGMSPARIVRVHALRPASPSAVAAVAAQSGFILGNVVIIERIFVLPGFGDYTLTAIGRRDVLAVAGALFVAAIILAVLNLIADALLLVLDPRLESTSEPW